MSDGPREAKPAGREQPKPGPGDGEPTDGPEAQKRREKMQHQEKAEGGGQE